MMIRAYLDWSRTAGAADRAEAVAMLARVFLETELSREDKRDAEAALVLALEDASPLVRQAMARTLAGSEHSPRAIIAALARDQAEIAAVVIANSPVLTDAEVADLAAFAAAPVIAAACARPFVSEALAEALAVAADAQAAAVLLDNPGAEVPIMALRALAARHGEDAGFREALLARDDVPADLRFTLADGVARQLAAFATAQGWMPDRQSERLRQEAIEAAAITVAGDAGDASIPDLASQLRRSGRLTPQLLLRAVLCGEIRLFAAALADLAEVDQRRAMGFIQARGGVGFTALCRKAGLPDAMTPAFAAAAAAWQSLNASGETADGKLSRMMVEMVLSAIALVEGPEMGKVRALLLGYQAEAVREEARLRISDILSAEVQVAEDPVDEILADEVPAIAAPMAVTPDGYIDDLEALLTDALEQEFREAA
jgi:uncharacterized protein (DUF2336 family)